MPSNICFGVAGAGLGAGMDVGVGACLDLFGVAVAYDVWGGGGLGAMESVL